ncbi:MAG TPA: SMC-Scp complex subunit ScpB [Thermoanaerobaculia bacterium]|nr:SMC-Scp complex subunit ScpB [Thermoanaerobaculia bacterium]
MSDEQPEIDRPETEQPEIEKPEPEQPEADQPDQPEAEQPEPPEAEPARERRARAERTPTEREEMEAVLEAILFVSSEPVPRTKLMELFVEDEREAAAEALEAVLARYTGEGRGVLVEDVAGGVRLATRPEVVGWLRRFFDVASGNKLSMAALETLAIIAYRQPMTGPEIQELRGVSASGVLKTLLERRLVRIVGRKEVVGKPFLYGTTREFLVHFGLNSLKDLPPLEEFEETFGSGDASAVAGLAEMAGLPPRMDEPEPRGEDREERILREIADLEERQEDEETP